MNLSFDEKRDIINYRVEKAYRTIKEAKDNAALGNWSLAANRLYYAIFYIALAINLNNGDSTKTHNGTFNYISKRYIATGLLTKEEGSLYRQLFSMRQSGDYDDLFDWTDSDILPIIPLVESLLEHMKSFLSLDNQ